MQNLIRMNVEDDRLSSLPDDLIHKILSFISIREAIGLSVLSSRWRFIWTSMPYLNFNNFNTFHHLSKFVSNLLFHRNNEINLYSVELLSRKEVSQEFLKTFLNYAFSHNVRQLTLGRIREPLSIDTSRSLKHLHLMGCDHIFSYIVTPTGDLPALTTLHLDRFTLSNKHDDNFIDLFSKCTNLKNLSLKGFRKKGTNVFNIYHPQLCNLKLAYAHSGLHVNVVAPQLKNLTIKYSYGKHMISAPGLASIVMRGVRPLQISSQGFSSLEKADLCFFEKCPENAHKIVCLLQQLHGVIYLTLNLEILRLLSLHYMGSREPSPFANLKMLKLITSYPGRVHFKVQNYQLDSSPRPIGTMVLWKDVTAIRNIIEAHKVIADIRVRFEQCKPLKKSSMQSQKAQVKKKSAFELFEEMMALIKQRKIEGLVGKSDSCHNFLWLQRVEGYLSELRASRKAVMQAALSSLYEEAAILTSNMKIHNNKKPSDRIRKSSGVPYKINPKCLD